VDDHRRPMFMSFFASPPRGHRRNGGDLDDLLLIILTFALLFGAALSTASTDHTKTKPLSAQRRLYANRLVLPNALQRSRDRRAAADQRRTLPSVPRQQHRTCWRADCASCSPDVVSIIPSTSPDNDRDRWSRRPQTSPATSRGLRWQQEPNAYFCVMPQLAVDGVEGMLLARGGLMSIDMSHFWSGSRDSQSQPLRCER